MTKTAGPASRPLQNPSAIDTQRSSVSTTVVHISSIYLLIQVGLLGGILRSSIVLAGAGLYKVTAMAIPHAAAAAMKNVARTHAAGARDDSSTSEDDERDRGRASSRPSPSADGDRESSLSSSPSLGERERPNKCANKTDRKKKEIHNKQQTVSREKARK